MRFTIHQTLLDRGGHIFGQGFYGEFKSRKQAWGAIRDGLGKRVGNKTTFERKTAYVSKKGCLYTVNELAKDDKLGFQFLEAKFIRWI